MPLLALRDYLPIEGSYKGFSVLAVDGCLYGVPEKFGKPTVRHWLRLSQHPTVLSAATLEELREVIDRFDPTPFRSELIDHFEDYDLFRHCGRIYGVPRSYTDIDLNVDEDRTRDGVLCGETIEEVRRLIHEYRAAAAVEFAGWMPIFERHGNCGNHPQFKHKQEPPTGYKFVHSGNGEPEIDPLLYTILRFIVIGVGMVFYPLVAAFRYSLRYGPIRTLSVFGSAAWLTIKLLCRGGRPDAVIRFVRSRHFGSQIRMKTGADLVFLTSMPYTYGQRPWVIEIEDSTTLLYPFLQNGRTRLLEIERSPFVRLVRVMLESSKCRAIITHLRSTAETVGTLLKSDLVARKTHYIPMGVHVPPRWQQHDDDGETLELLFTNSWHQLPEGFCMRGGLDVLEAFSVLHERYPHLRLTMRTCLPTLSKRFHDIIDRCRVRIFHRFVPTEQMQELMQRSHVFLLPAARIHVVSILQAMSYGHAVVVSDGWGFEEYVQHEHNGLVIPGRGGKVSWMDEDTGLLREDYGPMYRPDPVVIQGLVDAVARLVEDPLFRRALGRSARADVEEKYNWDQWNRRLGAVLDQARGVV